MNEVKILDLCMIDINFRNFLSKRFILFFNSSGFVNNFSNSFCGSSGCLSCYDDAKYSSSSPLLVLLFEEVSVSFSSGSFTIESSSSELSLLSSINSSGTSSLSTTFISFNSSSESWLEEVVGGEGDLFELEIKGIRIAVMTLIFSTKEKEKSQTATTSLCMYEE